MTSELPAGERLDEVADAVVEKIDEVLADGGDVAERVQDSRPYRILVTTGLIAYGVMHLLMAFLVVQVVRGKGVDASESGSIAMLVEVPLGFALVTVIALGMAALAVWQVLLALYGYNEFSGRELIDRKLTSIGRSVLYASFAVTAIRVLAGARDDSNAPNRTAATALLGSWAGPPLLVVVGAVVVFVGADFINRGVRRVFVEHDLDGHVPRWGVWLGVVGWVMKGVTQGIGGVLLWIAAWNHDPLMAGGLDLALKSIAERPFGRVALVVVAAGLVSFGVYCFLWAVRARHDVAKDDDEARPRR